MFSHDYIEVMYFGHDWCRIILCPFQPVIPGYMISVCLITGAANLDHIFKVVHARLLHCKIIVFVFIVN